MTYQRAKVLKTAKRVELFLIIFLSVLIATLLGCMN